MADELAAAADLAKGKLAGRPVAVVRGLAHLVVDDRRSAPGDLVRPAASDLFGYGSREAVLAAALAVTGQPERYEELVDLEPAERIRAVLNGSGLSGEAADLLRAPAVRRSFGATALSALRDRLATPPQHV